MFAQYLCSYVCLGTGILEGQELIGCHNEIKEKFLKVYMVNISALTVCIYIAKIKNSLIVIIFRLTGCYGPELKL